MATPPPKGVKFAVPDIELLDEFLVPHVNGHNFDNNLVKPFELYKDHPALLHHDDEMYFPPLHYWYYVKRLRLANNRPNRLIQNQPTLKWRYRSTTKLIRDSMVIGHKEVLDLETSHGVKTGWKQSEYRLESPHFQTKVLVHLFFDPHFDNTAPAAALLHGFQNGPAQVGVGGAAQVAGHANVGGGVAGHANVGGGVAGAAQLAGAAHVGGVAGAAQLAGHANVGGGVAGAAQLAGAAHVGGGVAGAAHVGGGVAGAAHVGGGVGAAHVGGGGGAGAAHVAGAAQVGGAGAGHQAANVQGRVIGVRRCWWVSRCFC